MSESGAQLAIRGAKEIGKAAGVSWKQVPRLVREHGLPAFKISGSSTWIILPEDLQRWLRTQADKALGRAEGCS